MSSLLIDLTFLVGPSGGATPEFLCALAQLAQELSFSRARWFYSRDALIEVFAKGLLEERRLREWSSALKVEVNTRQIVSEISRLLQDERQAVRGSKWLLASSLSMSGPFSARSGIALATYVDVTATDLLATSCQSEGVAFVTFAPAPHLLTVSAEIEMSDLESLSIGSAVRAFKVAQSPEVFAQALGVSALTTVSSQKELARLFQSFATKPLAPLHVVEVGTLFYKQFIEDEIRRNDALVETLLRNVALLAQGGPSAVEARAFRESENSQSDQKARAKDGALGYRLQLSKNGSGWRLNFWFRTGMIELGSIEKKNAKPVLPE
jgi:hypothetical protein